MAVNTTEPAQAVKRSLQFASEAVVPGGSNLLNGDFKSAGIYLVAGAVARAIFGWPGVLFVAANSFTKARTGRSLIDHLGDSDSKLSDTKK